MVKLLSIIGNVLFWIIILATLVVAAARIPAAPHRIFIVESGSMGEAVPTGSLIMTWQQKTYQVGQVVTFMGGTADGTPVTHRIVEIDDDGYLITQGDANEEPDYHRTKSEDVVGRVRVVIPKVGYAVAPIQQKLGELVRKLQTT